MDAKSIHILHIYIRDPATHENMLPTSGKATEMSGFYLSDNVQVNHEKFHVKICLGQAIGTTFQSYMSHSPIEAIYFIILTILKMEYEQLTK